MPSSTSLLVTVTRDGVIESGHLGDVVVATPDGTVTTFAGDATRPVYPRSALKPFQTTAVLSTLQDLGLHPQEEHLAIISASHDGGDDQQVEAASVLAEAGLDESALRCPADWPINEAVRAELDAPTTLSHNCSGKHAGMLWAHVAAGHDPATYLETDTVLQQRIARALAEILDGAPQGPGIDGCGAPAWLTTTGGLATGFARLAAGSTSVLAAVRDAMVAHPELVGGPSLPDTKLMLADARVVAKRGAEGVMGCGFVHDRLGPVGIAVKIQDGSDRAAGPVIAAVIEALGGVPAPDVRRVPVLGGGVPHGEISAVPELSTRVTEAFGLS